MAPRGASETGDPLLLTPGPLTTSAAVKQAMVHDWGSRDAEFIRINKMVLDSIVQLAGAEGTHVTVPVQGSGTFAVEAMITTFVPNRHALARRGRRRRTTRIRPPDGRRAAASASYMENQ